MQQPSEPLSWRRFLDDGSPRPVASAMTADRHCERSAAIHATYVIAAYARFDWLGTWLRGACCWLPWALTALVGWLPLPAAMLRQLENRHPLPAAVAAGQLQPYTGVVVLGGSLERLKASVTLLRQHPHLRLLFTGGDGKWWASGPAEADGAHATGAGHFSGSEVECDATRRGQSIRWRAVRCAGKARIRMAMNMCKMCLWPIWGGRRQLLNL